MAELPRGEGQTVLVIDDEPAIRSVARRVLQAFGYRVILAENGAEGVECYRRQINEVDVVLTDIKMPVMDGWEAARQIQALNPRARIIVASGTESPEDRSGPDSFRPRYFLAKPYTTRELLMTLRQALEGE